MRSSFDYAVVRVVPRVERGEFVNAGVIVFCRTKRFLAARVELDPGRLRALWPTVDVEEVQKHLAVIPRISEGGKGAGPIGRLPQADRFHWLTAPRSTVVQVSPVHSGLCDDPHKELEELMLAMVSVPGST